MFNSDEEIKLFLEGLDRLDDSKKRALQAYEMSGLNVTAACAACGIHRATFYYYCDTDWVFKRQREFIDEAILDMAESKLYEKIRGIYKKMLDEQGQTVLDERGRAMRTDEYEVEPNTVAIFFFLKTKGRKRGYIEHRREEDNDGNTGMAPIIDWRGDVAAPLLLPG